MLNYAQLELDVTAKINDYIANNSIGSLMIAMPMPENQAQINEVLKNSIEKTYVLVGYNLSTWGETLSANAVSQDEEVNLRLVFIGPTVRGASGIYTLMDYCKIALLGWQPENCTKRFLLTKNELADFENLGFRLFLDFKTATVSVQANEEEEIYGPAFKKADFN